MPMLLHKTPGLPIKPFINPLVSGAVLILPAAILVAPHLGEAAYLLLAVLGVYYFLSNSLHYRAYQPVLLLSFLTLGFVLIALALVLVSDNPSAGLSKLGNLREFMAAPFIGLLLLNTRVSTRFIMLTVKISAFLVFMTVYYQLLTGVIRPGGAVNPLVFAVPSLLLGFFSLARFPLESTAEKLLSLVAFSSGCMAAVISQSRAAWILSVSLLTPAIVSWKAIPASRMAVATQRSLRKSNAPSQSDSASTPFSTLAIKCECTASGSSFEGMANRPGNNGRLLFRLLFFTARLPIVKQTPLEPDRSLRTYR